VRVARNKFESIAKYVYLLQIFEFDFFSRTLLDFLCDYNRFCVIITVSQPRKSYNELDCTFNLIQANDIYYVSIETRNFGIFTAVRRVRGHPLGGFKVFLSSTAII
jgi:hypothetical protein